MNTLETGEKGFPLLGISPDVAATAAVLRSLYLPGECRHLVALLQDDGAAPAPRPARRVPPGCAGETLSDAAFLETVRTLLSPDADGPGPERPRSARHPPDPGLVPGRPPGRDAPDGR